MLNCRYEQENEAADPDRQWRKEGVGVQLIVDHSLVEVFLNRGLRAGTLPVWPPKPFDTLVVDVVGWHGDVGRADVSVQELRIPVKDGPSAMK